MTRERDIKISDLTVLNSMESSDSLVLVRNGQNFSISYSDLVASLGALGTLTTLGESTGVPVLDTDSLDYKIRNFINGSGVSIGSSPEDGVKISHNFTVNSDGQSTLINPTADSPTLRSLVSGPGVAVSDNTNSIKIGHNLTVNADGDVTILDSPTADSPILPSIEGGAGISVSKTDNVITIEESAGPVSSKTVIINSMSDFPDAVADVRTLEDDTYYFITTDLTTSDRFVVGNSMVFGGSDAQVVTFTYTGSGTLFTSLNDTNKFRDITFIGTSGTFLDWTSSLGSGDIVQFRNVQGTFSSLGTLTGADACAFADCNFTCITDGMTFTGANGLISFADGICALTAGTLIDLGAATTTGFSLRNAWVVAPSGTTILSGLADSGNVAAGSLASVLNVRLIGEGTFLNNISESDDLWDFAHCSGAVDSLTSALAVNAGATVTIAVVDTPVIIGVTWTTTHESRISGTAGGRWTYTGKGSHVSILASITADIVSGTKISCTFYYYKNGVIISGSAVQRDFTAGNTGNFSMPWAEDLETDDYIEIFAENNDGTANIEIKNAILRFD